MDAGRDGSIWEVILEIIYSNPLPMQESYCYRMETTKGEKDYAGDNPVPIPQFLVQGGLPLHTVEGMELKKKGD